MNKNKLVGVYKSFDLVNNQVLVRIEEEQNDSYLVTVYADEYMVLQRNVFESESEIDQGKKIKCYVSKSNDLRLEYDSSQDILVIYSKLISRYNTNFILKRT